MSAKANFVLLIISGLLLAALASRNGALAAMALPFLFYLAAGWLTSPGEIRLRAVRSLNKIRCETGDEVTHTVTIVNEGEDTLCIKLDDFVPSEFRITGENRSPRVALPGNESVEIQYRFTAPRGCYEWQTLPVTVSDPFGLFERRVELPAPARLLVLPQTLPLRKFPVRLSHTLHTVGPNLSRLPGTGIDFWGLREYHPGDSLRWIHWRSAARHPKQLFTKQFEREEMANVGLLLDARSITERTEGGENLLEHSIQATASLAKTLLQMGNRVSLLILGERLVRVFPGTGKRQLTHILDRLAECRPGDKNGNNPLKYLPVRLFPANSTIVMVSPMQTGDLAFFARARAEGYRVLLVSPDPVSFQASGYSQTPAASLAVRAAHLERRALLWRIRQLGVGVVDWPVGRPLAQCVRSIPHAGIGERL